MSHDELDTIDVIDEEEFIEEGTALSSDEPEKIVVAKKPRRAIRRLIEDALEERRLKAALKGYDDPLLSSDLD
ncbi:MAG: hypothetical protein K2X50_07905 [Gammaproteobacteria bacterium]|nr:hypothetical protein [Gammaproteobacteria bacterium]